MKIPTEIDEKVIDRCFSCGHRHLQFCDCGCGFDLRPGNWREKEQAEKETVKCSSCNGTGKEICSNPDHGFIDGIGGEIARLGCPGCGHDELYRTNQDCNKCSGKGFLEGEE